jgi:hypothetical protein
VVPKDELKTTTNNGKKLYYFPIAPNKNGQVGGIQVKYLNNWDLLIELK